MTRVYIHILTLSLSQLQRRVISKHDNTKRWVRGSICCTLSIYRHCNECIKFKFNNLPFIVVCTEIILSR